MKSIRHLLIYFLLLFSIIGELGAQEVEWQERLWRAVTGNESIGTSDFGPADSWLKLKGTPRIFPFVFDLPKYFFNAPGLVLGLESGFLGHFSLILDVDVSTTYGLSDFILLASAGTRAYLGKHGSGLFIGAYPLYKYQFFGSENFRANVGINSIGGEFGYVLRFGNAWSFEVFRVWTLNIMGTKVEEGIPNIGLALCYTWD